MGVETFRLNLMAQDAFASASHAKILMTTYGAEAHSVAMVECSFAGDSSACQSVIVSVASRDNVLKKVCE